MTLYVDNTLLKDCKACLRLAYYRHQRHWVRKGLPAAALRWGASWHKAMDAVWPTLVGGAPVGHAATVGFRAFEAEWNSSKKTDASTEPEKLGFRTLDTAWKMLQAYCTLRAPLLSRPDVGLIAVEQPFGYGLMPDAVYVGRIDKILRIGSKIHPIEHKTTSMYSGIVRDGTVHFRQSYLDSYCPNAQVDGYLEYCRRKYGERLGALWVDVALVHASVHDVFTFLPVDRTKAQLEHAQGDARWWANQYQTEELAAEPPIAEHAWPRNTESCFTYNRSCEYLPLCKDRDDWWNVEEVPAGYEVSPWKPVEKIESITASARSTWLEDTK